MTEHQGIELDIVILIQKNIVKFIIISDNFPALEHNDFKEEGGVSMKAIL